MNRSPNTRVTDRLVEYCAVVGPGDELVVLDDGPASYETPSGRPDPFRTEFGAAVLDRYPLDDHADIPFPTGVSNFCFPLGVRLRRPTPPDEPLPTFYTFIATGGKGDSIFGHVLTFWECVTASQLACFDSSVVGESGEGAAAAPGASRGVASFFAPKAFCLLSRWDFGSEFRTILTELYRTSVSPSQVPLERYISNIASEIALPPAGRLEVIYQIAGETVTFRRPPKNRLVSPLGLPFREVFECLDADNLLLLLRAVLLEKQVLLVSSQLSLLSSAAEVLVSLVFPFRWCHTLIPVMPRGLMDVLQAPTPFILGLHVEQWHEVAGDIPPWVVQVDLDHNKVETGEALNLPPLGERPRRKLLRALRANGDVFAHRGADWATARLPNYDSAFSFAARPSEPGTSDAFVDSSAAANAADEAHDPGSDEDERAAGSASTLGGYTGAGSGRSGVRVNWHAVRRAFFRLFVSLFLRYREFVVYPSSAAQAAAAAVASDALATARTRRFDKEGFLATVAADSRALAEALMDTQAFANFIDDRIQPERDAVDVVFFDESIDAKLNRSLFTFTKRETPFLDSREYGIAKTTVALQPDTAALPDYPARLYHYSPLPRLDRMLYGRRREVPCYADSLVSGGMDHMRLRRAGLPWAAVAGSAGGSTPAAGGSGSSSHVTVRLTAAENVYMSWFLVFASALDVVGAEVGRVTGEAFDLLERADALDTMQLQQAEQQAAARLRQQLAAEDDMRQLGAALGLTADSAGDTRGALVSEAPSATTATAAAAATAAGDAGSLALASLLPNASLSPPPLPPRRSLAHFDASSVSDAGAALPSMALGRERGSSNAAPAAALTAGASPAPLGGALPRSRSAVKSTIGSGGRSVRTPALIRRETAIATAKGLFFSQQLEVAFAVYERMVAEAVPADEAVFRALLDICGRCGNFGKAYAVMGALRQNGIAQDATLYQTLFRSFFSGTPDAGSAAAFQNVPLGALEFGGRPGGVSTPAPGAGHRIATSVSTRKPLAADALHHNLASVSSSEATPMKVQQPPTASGQTVRQPVTPAGQSVVAAPSAAPAVAIATPATSFPSTPPPAPPANPFASLFSWGKKSKPPQPPRAGSTAAAVAAAGTSVLTSQSLTTAAAARPIESPSQRQPQQSLPQPQQQQAHPPSPQPPQQTLSALTASSGPASASDNAEQARETTTGTPVGDLLDIAGIAATPEQARETTTSAPVNGGSDVEPTVEIRPASIDAAAHEHPTEATGTSAVPPIPQSSATDSATAISVAAAPPHGVLVAKLSTPEVVASPPGIARRRLSSFITAADFSAFAAAEVQAHPPAIVINATVFDRKVPVGIMASRSVAPSVLTAVHGGTSAGPLSSSTAAGSGNGSWFSARSASDHAGTNGGGRSGSNAASQPPPFSATGSQHTGPLRHHAGWHGTHAMDSAAPQGSRQPHALSGSQTPSLVQPLASPLTGLSGPMSSMAPPLERACADGSLALIKLFPGLCIDTLRETCPTCDRALSDADIRAGWVVGGVQDYTTVCPVCPPVAPGVAAPVGRWGQTAAAASAPPAAGGGGGGGGWGTPANATAKRLRFVARFSVTCDAPGWRGSAGAAGPGTLLFCEYLPPGVLVKELQAAVAHGQFGPLLRQSCPSLFWNLVLWFSSFALPCDALAHTARGDENDEFFADLLPAAPALSGGRTTTLSVTPPARATRGRPPDNPGQPPQPPQQQVAIALSASVALRERAAQLVAQLPSVAAQTAAATVTQQQQQ